MRGQAFIVYESVESSTRALNASKDQVFFGKMMNVSYAKGKSNLTQSLEFQQKTTKKRRIRKKKKNTHRIFVQNFPLVGLEKYATPLFKEFAGFTNVIFEDTKPGTAFVEFQTASHAKIAADYLQGFRLTSNNVLTCQQLEDTSTLGNDS